MQLHLNLKTVALEYPEEIRKHPIPLILFWGDPQTTQSLFGTGIVQVDNNRIVNFTHKGSDYGYVRKTPRDVSEMLRIEQKGILKPNWMYKHHKEIPSGLILFFLLLCIHYYYSV